MRRTRNPLPVRCCRHRGTPGWIPREFRCPLRPLCNPSARRRPCQSGPRRHLSCRASRRRRRPKPPWRPCSDRRRGRPEQQPIGTTSDRNSVRPAEQRIETVAPGCHRFEIAADNSETLALTIGQGKRANARKSGKHRFVKSEFPQPTSVQATAFFHHGGNAENHGGPRQSEPPRLRGPLRLPWPSVVLRVSSVVKKVMNHTAPALGYCARAAASKTVLRPMSRDHRKQHPHCERLTSWGARPGAQSDSTSNCGRPWRTGRVTRADPNAPAARPGSA